MTILAMAAIGFIVGFALDEIIARLAREPYERGEMDDEEVQLKGNGRSLELGSESGALAMPRALTSGSVYRRALVVGTTVALLAVAGKQYQGDALSLGIIAGYIAVFIVCTGTDVLAYRVPNVITYPAILIAFTLGLTHEDASRGDVLLGGAVMGGVFLAMAIATRGGMGMGDVKLALFTGIALGFSLGIPALLITAILGGVVAIVLMVSRLRDRRDPIPYAPFISAGALVVLLTQGAAFTTI